jgi:hypothetical protein
MTVRRYLLLLAICVAVVGSLEDPTLIDPLTVAEGR